MQKCGQRESRRGRTLSLRNRLLVLFAIFGILPLSALGSYEYVRTQRAVESLIAAQTAQLAERAAAQLADRWARLRSDLLLLAENAETRRIYDTPGDPVLLANALELAEPFFRDLWQQIGPAYDAIELRDAADRQLYRFGDADRNAALPATTRVALEAHELVRDPASGRVIGRVVATPRLVVILPLDALQTRFGESGYSMVVERTTGRVLYHPRHGGLNQRLQALLAGDSLRAGELLARPGTGRFTFGHGDSMRVASWVSLEQPAWALVASGSVSEFGGSFARLRRDALLLVLLFTLLALTAFTLAIRRATRSLEALTRAADQVGRGNFVPELPPAGSDELGRLALAFQVMTAKVSDMLAQLERSRQLAAIGEFAAEISHEIRNPLTAVKLNLQRIDRALRGEPDPRRAAAPLAISLREIDRLERVVRGVLQLGRPQSGPRAAVRLRDVVEESLGVVRQQADEQQVEITTSFDTPDDIEAEVEPLRAALLNLLVNALEAMPAGGRLRLWTEPVAAERDAVALLVEDNGAGIPPAQREQLFRPFHTTKPQGTGLGLAAALRTIEAHDGKLSAIEPRYGAGAAFRLELPLRPVEVPA